jgi:beta-lactamase class A
MKKNEKIKQSSFKTFLNSRVPLYMFLGAMFMVCGATIVLTRIFYSPKPEGEQQEMNKSEYNIRRLKGYKFIQPLLSAKPIDESIEYSDIKQSVANLIQKYTDQGIISTASVYMRDFDQSNWFNVNSVEQFIPGSILKLVVLLTYMKTEENYPGTLNKIIVNNKIFETKIKQNIVVKSIEPGKAYTVRQLLEYMIVYSDNNANLVLNDNMNLNDFAQVFKDLNLKVPEKGSSAYTLTSRECSRFMEVLFNATYLDNKNSEYAMNLLTRCQFLDGIVKGVPESNLLIAHKFGESGDNIFRQLHETAILYIKEKPYLITIMTKGNKNVDLSRLSEVLRGVSNLIYTKLADK